MTILIVVNGAEQKIIVLMGRKAHWLFGAHFDNRYRMHNTILTDTNQPTPKNDNFMFLGEKIRGEKKNISQIILFARCPANGFQERPSTAYSKDEL